MIGIFGIENRRQKKTNSEARANQIPEFVQRRKKRITSIVQPNPSQFGHSHVLL